MAKPTQLLTRAPVQPIAAVPSWSTDLGGAAWRPTNLGSLLVAWWTADRSDLITLSASQVTSWKDVVGGYDLSQATSGSRPIYSATSWNSVAPGIAFDGVDDRVSLASVPASFPVGSDPSNLYGVADQTALVADVTNRTLLLYGGTLLANTRRIRRVSSGGNKLQAVVGDGATSFNSVNTADLSGRHVMAGIVSATAVHADQDGVAGPTTTGVPATILTNVVVGSNASGIDCWQGVVRDVLLTLPLNAAQDAALNTWLQSRRN